MQVAAHAHGDEGMQRYYRRCKTIEHGTEMSDATMDLMIKYNAYYIPTLSAGSYVAEKALIPNYYPAIVVPKALAIGPKLKRLSLTKKRSAYWFWNRCCCFSSW
jgi:hypothetical protein